MRSRTRPFGPNSDIGLMRAFTVIVLTAALARPAAADNKLPAAGGADWNARCRARFEKVRAKAAAFGKVTLISIREPADPLGIGWIRLDVRVGQSTPWLFAIISDYDPPDTYLDEPRKVPQIWDRWHEHAEDAEVGCAYRGASSTRYTRFIIASSTASCGRESE